MEKTLSQITIYTANHISKTFGELKEQELIKYTNSEVRKCRLCRLTDKGEEIVDKFNSN